MSKRCSACGESRERSEFSGKQWAAKQIRRCNTCIQAGTPVASLQAGPTDGPATAEPAEGLIVGSAVRLFGLNAPGFNGRVGRIRARPDEEGDGRYTIEFRTDEAGFEHLAHVLRIKPSNFQPAAKKLPRWSGSSKHAMNQRQVNEQRMAVLRSAACGTYELKWAPDSDPSAYRSLAGPVTTLPPLSKLQIRWRDPELAPSQLPPSAFDNTSYKGTAGTVECDYYDPATLAAEFHCLASRHTLDEHKQLDGGLMRLVGEADLFWSAVLHFAEAGSVAPQLPPHPDTGRRRLWAETALLASTEKVLSDLKRTVAGGANLRGQTLTATQRLMSTTIAMNMKHLKR